jgi:hypothetical protein
MSATVTGPAESAPQESRPLSGIALGAAVASLVALGLFTAYMIFQTDTDSEVTWSRLAWLFSSVEAIAFGAAGALFGAKVHRERAEKAEAEARHLAVDAAKGKALAAAIKADEGPDEEPATRGLGGDAQPSIRTRHARLARELFPD